MPLVHNVLRELRAQRGLSQGALGDALGVSRQTVNAIETGKYDPLRPLEHIAFTVPFNMSEQPAASINCGTTADGLPIGLQIAGPRFDDLGVLQVARAFELIRAPQRPWPDSPTA